MEQLEETPAAVKLIEMDFKLFSHRKKTATSEFFELKRQLEACKTKIAEAKQGMEQCRQRAADAGYPELFD